MRGRVPFEGSKTIGIWIRVSSEDQAKGDSPAIHEKRARLYAEAKGWDVSTVYHLEGVSGRAVAGHTECRRMVEDVKKGRIKALIFSKLARLARNTRELLDFADLFKAAHCDLISLQESIDTSTPAGRLFYTMIAAMAQWEREEIADRIKAAFAVKAKMGKTLNAKAPYGYRNEKGKLVPHPEEAPVRRQIYKLFLETGRIKTTAKLLNEAGYRTRSGAKFNDTTIRRNIRNSTAKGIHIINYSTSLTPNKRDLKPREDWVEIQVEPIVETQIWDQANAILDERLSTAKRPGPRPVQLFSGLTYCHCGCRMYPRVNTPKYVCAHCKNKIAIEDLEGVFLDQLKGFFLSEAEVRASIEAARGMVSEKQARLDSHFKELDRVNVEIRKVYDLYQAGQIPVMNFRQFFDPLEERRSSLEIELPKLQADVDVSRISELSAETVLTEARDLHSSWPKFSFEDKRKIVESITQRIVIERTEVVITLCYLPGSEELTKSHRILCGAGCGMDAA